MLITIDKCLHNNFFLRYLKDLLTLRSTAYSLRGTDIYSLCKPAATSYGLHAKLGTLNLRKLERSLL